MNNFIVSTETFIFFRSDSLTHWLMTHDSWLIDSFDSLILYTPCWHRSKKVGVAVKQSGRDSDMKIYAHFHSWVIFLVTARNNLLYLNDPERYHGRFVCNSNKRRRMDIIQILGCSGLIHSIYFHQRSSIVSWLHWQFWDATRWCFRSFIS